MAYSRYGRRRYAPRTTYRRRFGARRSPYGARRRTYGGYGMRSRRRFYYGGRHY